MNGVLTDGLKLVSNLRTNLNITGSLRTITDIKGNINSSTTTYPDYAGSYEITPIDDEQILNTKNKITREDITVKKIPYFQTSNEYGDTVYIGSEV